jgi:hypothetical protein
MGSTASGFRPAFVLAVLMRVLACCTSDNDVKSAAWENAGITKGISKDNRRISVNTAERFLEAISNNISPFFSGLRS